MIKVIDDFLPQKTFKEIKQYAEGSGYYDSHDFNGYQYHGIDATQLDHPIAQQVLDVINQGILKPMELKSHFSIFRKGHMPTRWIHADNACGGYASVLYLTEHEKLSGTAFWEHNRYPAPSWEGFNQFHADDINQGDCEVEQMWTMRRFVEAKKNRLVIYSANEFHSVYPKQGPHDRRVLVSFINQGVEDEN